MHRSSLGTPNRFPDMHRFKIPDAPISPYMKFSKKNWNKIRVENSDRPLWEVSKLVAQRWRELPDAERNEYHQAYEHERTEYDKTMRSINTAPITQQTVLQKRHRQGGSRRLDPNSGVVIQPVIDEDPFEVTPKKVAAMRFERNQRLLMELFNGVPMPDVRTFVSPGRIDALRKQSDTLESHRKRISDEMIRIEESYNNRKKAIQETADRFDADLEKVNEMRPVVSEEMYAKMVDDAEKKLLVQWEQFQKRQEQMKLLQEAERKEAPILYSLTVSSPSQNSQPSTDPIDSPMTKTNDDPTPSTLLNSNLTRSTDNAVSPASIGIAAPIQMEH